jgi:3D (Asp-Asp-Asp) domain-containing protein|tara:strand:+ start:784 stop:1131 length:348 start_codon:yes stop_codon:yes gene_type:complete
MNILKIIIVTATIYHATPEQTDSTPYITASNKFIDMCDPQKHRWIAVSRDLEKKGLVFGVKVKITGAGHLDGIWTVQDRMNRRWTNRIDFLVNKDLKGGKWENVKVEIINYDKRL